MGSVIVVDTTACVRAKRDISLCFDLGERRVESLRVIVVEDSRLSVVFFSDVHEVADLLRLSNSSKTVTSSFCVEARHILISLFTGLKGVLLCLDRVVENGLVARNKTPISSLFVSYCFLLLFSSSKKLASP